MIEDKPELYDIPIEQLELWEEANVRKSQVLQNIEELAGNIKRYGVQVPLLVKEVKENEKYLIFSGQRRFEASKIAEIDSLPCFVFKKITVTEAQILSFSENLYRESMTMDDKSRAANELYKKLKDMGKVAKVLGVNERTVRRYLKYDDIPEELRKYGRKPYGNLAPNEIEDIYFRFPDLDRAIAVAKKLNSIKKGTLQRRKYHASVRLSTPSDDVGAVSRRADKLIKMKTFSIVLEDTRSKTLEKIASVRKMQTEDFIADILNKWIDDYLDGNHR